ncbi:MAG TPA: TetR/AcrR family transcriptional regulator [Acidimicrobiales bacterium]|nr:TetR/AcrR family transcriptional regulator [Acidimicrobiales bacterium]
MTYAPRAVGAPAVAQRRARSPRGQGEQLRDEILAAAERILIETNDQSALSIRAIANAVGVTPPSIYLHFTDRNDLVFAVCERHAEQLERVMADAAEGIDDPWERIRRRGRAYLQWGLENPEHYRILMMSRPDQTPDRFVDERLADTAGLVPVADDVVQAIATQQVASGEEPLEMAKMLWMMIHGTVSLLISKPEFPFGPVDDVYERLFELVQRGLAPRPADC